MNDPQIYLKQAGLKHLGFDPGLLDGIDGKNTQNAERDYLASLVALDGLKKRDSKPVESAPVASLVAKQISIVVGHEPSGGAKGERAFNIGVANHMVEILKGMGAYPRVFFHKLKSYTARQKQTMVDVRYYHPNSLCTIELHFNGVSNPSAHGHEFQYRGVKSLARSIQKRFVEFKPDSRPRHDNGIKHNPDGRGSGFLKYAPSAACLVEPFFQSNPKEWNYWKDRQYELAVIYCKGIADYANSK